MAFPNSIDEGALFFFVNSHHPKVDGAVVTFTQLGAQIPLAIGLGFGCTILLAMRRPWSALLLALCLVTAMGFSYCTQQLVDRPRPSEAKQLGVVPKTPSFPSDYALNSMALYLALGLMVSRDAKSGWAKWATLPFFLLAFLIGVSRLYVGHCYVFDVIGGWIAGIAFALLFAWFDLQLVPQETPVEEQPTPEPVV